MKHHYRLKQVPYVVPNISTLSKKLNISISQNLQKQIENILAMDGVTLAYAGNLQNERNIDALIDIVLRDKQKYKLLIIGDGPNKPDFQRKAEEAGDRILFTGSLPYEQLGCILQLCDVGYLYYPDGELNCKYCASNKVYEYASVNLPVLANENPTVKKIYDRWGIGICDNDMERGLNKLLDNIEEYKCNCVAFNKEFDWNKVKLEYQNTIRQFLME